MPCYAEVVITALIGVVATATAAAEDWRHYVNPRFGVSADIPIAGFTPDPPPANGDGQSWTASSDGGTIVVYGAFQVVAADFEGYRAWALAAAREGGIAVTYERHGAGWFVYSGLNGARIVYERVESGCAGTLVVAIRFDYPAVAKRLWDPIVKRGASSLAPPPAASCS